MADEADTASVYEEARSSLKDSISDLECIIEEEIIKPPRHREHFRSKTSYLLTIIGFTVGFGNFWRFPAKFQTYGGVFLIPYAISIVCLGFPVIYMELAIGQRLRSGPVGCWNEISPYLGGIGITTGIICLFVGFYYNMLIAYCLSYLSDSFFKVLPWANCAEAIKHVRGSVPKMSECEMANYPSKFYWYRVVLDVSDSLESVGNFNWKLYICLILAWFVVGVVLIKGLEFTSRVVHFTATFPYYILSIFLVFGWTLHGFHNGYKDMFTFEFEKLLIPRIWMDAGSQILFSLGVGSGVLISYSSCLPVTNNVLKDALVVTSVNVGSSMLSAFVVFGILGFKATEVFESCHIHRAVSLADNFSAVLEKCSTIEEYIDETTGEGGGVAFISFAEAIRRLPVSQIFNITFFLMLLTLGIDSTFGTIEGCIFAFLDIFPNCKRWVVATFVTWILTFFSILLSFGWGNYIVNLLDYFAVDYPILSVCFLECIAVGWVYGLGRFAYDLQLMTGRRPSIYVLACIKYISPALILTLILGSIAVQCSPGSKSFNYYPWNSTTATDHEPVALSLRSILLAFIVVAVSWSWMPIAAIFAVFKRPLFSAVIPMEFPEADLRLDHFDDDPKHRYVNVVEDLLFRGSGHDFPRDDKKEDKLDGEMGLEPEDQDDAAEPSSKIDLNK